MTTTTAHFKGRNGPNAGFTLTELMIVMTLTVIMSGALFSAFGFVMRSSFAIANYADMTSEGRRGLELFARDVRSAEDIIDFSETSLTLYLNPPDADDYEVVYRYDASDEVFEREVDGDSRVLMRDVKQFHFRRFNLLRNEAMNNLETVQIQLELSMVKSVIDRDTSEKVVSARYIMRNKQVTQ